MTTTIELGMEIGRQPCRSDGQGGRIFTHGPLAGVKHRPYRATQPGKTRRSCSRCDGAVVVGDMIWRGLAGLPWCCERCGADEAHRVIAAAARARAVEASQRRDAARRGRDDYRDAVRAGSLGRWRR